MTRHGFEIHRKRDGEIIIFLLSGAMDSASAGTLKATVGPLLDTRAVRVVLDCTDLSYVNSMAMGQFTALHRSCEQNGGRMVMCGVLPGILEVMKLLKLDKMLRIVPTQAAALAALND